MEIFFNFLKASQLFFLIYLLIYATFLLLSLVLGGIRLYEKSELQRMHDELDYDYCVPVSILVPAYNEEVTIVDSVNSLLELDYETYEIIVVNDGSTDNTANLVRDTFNLIEVDKKIDSVIPCKPYKKVYQKEIGNVMLTLIEKENGGKGDVLNLGINASKYDYFLCLDADSMLQHDSLEKLVRPLKEHKNVVAVGGMVQVAQGVKMKNGRVLSYHLPWKLIPCAQVVEYDCSFLGSKILLDYLKANLIISGAFGLFKKDIVVSVGGYDTITLGEDMELVMKLHYFCRNNNKPYRICYETNSICWSQVPTNIWDLCKQRRRWFLGLFQCMKKYKKIFVNPRFGFVGSISYLYYLVFELIAPIVEIFGRAVIALSILLHQINIPFFISLYLLYTFYCTIITFTSFLQRVYLQNLIINGLDILKAINISIFKHVFLHWILSICRVFSFIGYKNKKDVWGDMKRESHNEI